MAYKGISLVGFATVAEIESYLEQCPDACFELSYNMSPEFLKEVSPLLQGRVLSLHACVPEESFFPNFGSYDPDVLASSRAAVERTAETAVRHGADIIVLHPGYLTDFMVSSRYEERSKLMNGPEFEPFVGRKKGSIARSDLISMSEYQSRFTHMADEIGELQLVLQRRYGVRIAVENLNPRAGYLNMSPDELKMLPSNISLCLDVGHLWISHFVFGFDFLTAVSAYIADARLVTMHLHSNKSDGLVLEDTHDDFFANCFPSAKILDLVGDDVNLILETVKNPVENTRFLFGFRR